jgi:Protein of unknown function (DUF4240)
MSYRKFVDEAASYLDLREKDNLPGLTMDEAFAHIRDKWIVEKKYSELISFIVENWEGNDCDDFIRPWSNVLIETGERTIHKQLWKSIIKKRVSTLWMYLRFLKEAAPEATIETIKILDLKGANPYSSTQSFEQTVAWQRLYAINAINEFMNGLKKLNEFDEVEAQMTLLKQVTLLKRSKPKQIISKAKIGEKAFWRLIAEARRASNDQASFLNNLKTTLEKFEAKQIMNFQKILAEKTNQLNTWEHWALAYIARRGCSDDGFQDFKAWAVSKGEQAYNIIKTFDEERLVSLFDEDPQLEELYYLAEEVYQDKTSSAMSIVSDKKSTELTGQKWNEENLKTLFPSLCQLFGYK